MKKKPNPINSPSKNYIFVAQKILKITCLVTLFVAWQTYFQLHGLFSDLNLFSKGISWKLIDLVLALVCMLITSFLVLLYTPLSKRICVSLNSFFQRLRSTRWLNILWPVIGLIVFALTLIDPLKNSFSIHRLIPLAVWMLFLSILTSLFTIFDGILTRIRTASLRFFKVLFLLIIAFITLFWYPYLLLSPVGEYFATIIPRIILFLIQVLFDAEMYIVIFPNRKFDQSLAIMAISSAAVLITAQNLATIISYPFSLDWSEGKWFLDASMVFSRKVYGVSFPVSWSEPTRILFQSIPYVFTNAPSILVLRVWQCALVLALPAIVSFFFIARLLHKCTFSFFLAFFFFFVMLFIGPTKYYLVLIALPLAFLSKRRSIFMTSLIVVSASLLVPPTRFNWIPVPGCVAAFLYFLENKVSKGFFKYIWRPVLWILLGTIVSFSIYLLYLQWQPSLLDSLTTVTSSPLLFNRLFATGTNLLGILPSALLVSIPLFIVLSLYFVENKGKLHIVRVVGLCVILFIFFLGGIIASLKIGGGNNLHNLDGFLFFSSILIVYVIWNLVQPDQKIPSANVPIKGWVTMVAIIVPSVWIAINATEPLLVATPTIKKDEVQTIQNFVNSSTDETGKPALLIYQTQLIATGAIHGVAPDPIFNNVQLMEVAMTDNEPVLAQFHAALIAQKWGLILVPPMNLEVQDVDHPFSEEHNAWVQKIVKPLLCFYQPVYNSLDFDFELLIPISDPLPCDVDLLP